jgi:hypothetical protein
MKNIYTNFAAKFSVCFKVIMLVGMMGVGVKGWGQSATYTVTSTSAATQSGTKPSGAGHTYTQTFGTTKQITSGNSATLTLTGYAGNTITSIILNMASNASAGAGTLNVLAGSTTIATVTPTAAFNTVSWNNAWSGNPTFVNITKTPSVYNIGSGQNVVITIAATTNSLYINSYTINYAPIASSYSGVTAGAGAEPATLPSTTTALSGAIAPQTNAILNYDFFVTCFTYFNFSNNNTTRCRQ